MFTCEFDSDMNKRLDNALKIKELREKVKMSQDDFARICFNVYVDKLKFWEENNYSVLDLTTNELLYFLEFAQRWSEILKMKVF
jgi:hypothetical protein